MKFDDIIYHTAKGSCKVIARIIFRLDIEGLDNIPQQGRTILCVNHLGNLDPFVVGSLIKRKIYFMAKEELFKTKITNKIFRAVGAFPIKRGKADLESIKSAIRYLKDEQILGIFPEGTRNKSGDGKVMKAKPGIAMFAIKTDSQIVPVAVSGKYKLFGKIKIRFGKPYKLQCEDRKYSNDELSEISGEIMQRVQLLLDA